MKPKLLLVPLLMLSAIGCPGGSSQPPAGPAAEASLEAALAHGASAFKDGDYVEAQAAYEEALRLEPDQAQATAALGTCYLKNRQVRKAHDLLADFLARHPENFAVRLVLARTLIRETDFDAAAVELRRVLTTDPDNLLAHYNLGFMAYRSRRYDEAVEQLQRTIALRPNHPEAHYTLGLTYMAQGRNSDAVAELQKAIEIDPRHVGAHFNLAAAAARAGLQPLAAAEQKEYALLSGRNKAEAEQTAQVKASSLKAVELLMSEDFAGALAEYQKLLQANPGYAPLYNDIGRVQLKLGRRDEAMQSLRRAVELDPRLSEPHYLLANLYRDKGDQEAAGRELAAFTALETIPEGKSGY